MRQMSEKRSSLRFPLKFSEFHQRSSATASSWSELKPNPTPPPAVPKLRLVNYFYFVYCKSSFETFHFNWVGLIFRSVKTYKIAFPTAMCNAGICEYHSHPKVQWKNLNIIQLSLISNIIM